MDSLSNATQMSILTRFLANVFIFCVLMTALVVAGTEIVQRQPVDPILTSVLATGIGYALHMLGLNQGVTLEPVQPVLNKPVPPAPEQQA